MKLYLVKTPSGHLVPASVDDRLKLRTLKPGDMLPVRIRHPRNGDHHRKFMSLVSFVAANHPRYRDMPLDGGIERVLTKLKLETGHYDHHVLAETGELVYMPRSISFEDMDEGEFVVWSKSAREYVYAHLLPGFTDRDKVRLAGEIDNWLAWT